MTGDSLKLVLLKWPCQDALSLARVHDGWVISVLRVRILINSTRQVAQLQGVRERAVFKSCMGH